MDITTFTILALAIYLFGLKLISLIAVKKSTQTTEDYFLASRSVGTLAIIATTMASLFSTATVVAFPAEFYNNGINFFWIFSFSVMSLTMLPLALRFWILGKKKNFITPGDLVGEFYQSKAAKVTIAIVGLLSLLPYAIAQIVAVGKTFESLTSGIIGYDLGIIIVSMAIGLYLFYGGSRAVILTDLVQGIVFASLVITGGLLCLYWSSGWENLIHNLTVSKPDNVVFDINIGYYEKVLLATTFFMLPHMLSLIHI